MSLVLEYLQETFKCPPSFGPNERVMLGNLIINEIKKRCSQSIDADGNKFPKYTPGYKASHEFKVAGKTSKVDLELSGDMLAELKIITHVKGQIRIGYKKTDSQAGKVQGNQSGIRGNSADIINPRPFIGLPDPILQKLINEVNTTQLLKLNNDLDDIIKKIKI